VELQAELEGYTELGPSAYEGLTVDPRSAAAQYDTLARMQEIAGAGGLDSQAQARLAQAQAANAGQERAQRGAILDTFARRGGGNSNSALLAALANQQGSAQRAGMEGLQIAGDAEARAYRALADSGFLAGQVRGQDYQQASGLADARDRFSMANAAARQAVAQRNADRANRAREGSMDAQYRRAGMLGGASGNERGYYANRERQKRGLYHGVGSGVGRNVGTGMDWMTGGGMP
jgi:hypothetical protein